MNHSNPAGIPVLGCIADDVTGATDLATNLTQGGMRVVQVIGVPTPDDSQRVQDADAVVVALKSRSIEPSQAITQSTKSLDWLQQLGAKRFYFKYCSTFDSTDRGNIGPVAEALMDQLNVTQTLFCPAFPRAGRTVYQGHLFVFDRLLSESSLRHHPLNPMTDADLVRVLGSQTTQPVGLLRCDTIDTSPDACRHELNQLADAGIRHVITDTCNDHHLETLAKIAATMPLVTGGSGLARFLPTAYRSSTDSPDGIWEPTGAAGQLPAVGGRNLILAGSCSAATQQQVRWMQDRYPSRVINFASLVGDPAAELADLIAWAGQHDEAETLMVSSTSAPDVVAQLQAKHGASQVAEAIETLFGEIATRFVDELSFRRLVVAGGETSGAITRHLKIRCLRIGPEICAGVPWTVSAGTDVPLALALKSGNFGEEDFFEVALRMQS